MKKRKVSAKEIKVAEATTEGSAAMEGGVERLPTGIRGFDALLEGGIPRGRATLIAGSTGTGKTVLINEFLYRGATEFKENGVFVTCEESPKDIVRNVRGFGWDYGKLMKQNRLAFVDVTPEPIVEITEDYSFSPLIGRIRHAVAKIKAQRVVLDSLGSLFMRFRNRDRIRDMISLLCSDLKEMGVTTLITAERVGDQNGFTRCGVEEFVADGVIELILEKGQEQLIRKMMVRKLRGAGYRSGEVEFEITEKGIDVFPKIHLDRRFAKTDFTVRKKFGIEGLDTALGGGIPQGHMVLVSGNTGTGKTSLAMQFIVEGIRTGEKAVYVALEEPVEQVRKIAAEHGWDFDRFEREGKLIIVSASLVDIRPGKFLYEILDAVSLMDAKRVIVDSMSSIISATISEEQGRQFLIQLAGILKARGVTCIMNYLLRDVFGAEKGQLMGGFLSSEMRMSSIVDGMILLRYVERGQRVKKLMNILKMRGCYHDKDIFRYEIKPGGIVLGEKYEE